MQISIDMHWYIGSENSIEMSIDVQMCTVHRFSFIHYVNKETRMTYEPYR